MICAKCGATNQDTSTYCQSCGNDLRVASSTGSSSSAGGAGNSQFVTSAPKASFSISSAFSDAIALVRGPAAFMNANAVADPPMRSLMINYVAVLAAIPFVATLVGDLWYYGGFLGAFGFGYAIATAVLTYILDIVAVFVVGFVIWKLAPNFATTTSQVRATKLAAYAFTPAFLISIVNIIPFVGFLTILGLLYGLYILYLGLPILLNTPKDKVLTYVIVTVVATLVVYVVIGAIIGAVTAAFFLAGVGFFLY